LILGGWRHLYERVPLKYDPQYWGMVFPLGMYTACTFQLSRAIQQPFLIAIPHVFIYVALFAWAAAFIGMILNITKFLFESSNQVKRITP
jgi:tellurite resistance protein TehA-like permease